MGPRGPGAELGRIREKPRKGRHRDRRQQNGEWKRIHLLHRSRQKNSLFRRKPRLGIPARGPAQQVRTGRTTNTTTRTTIKPSCMKPVENTQQRVITSGYLTSASVILLLIHFFVVCHGLMASPTPGPFDKVLDRLREVFQNLPFTGDEIITKACALGLLITSSLAPRSGKPRRRLNYAYPTTSLAAGLLLYFGSARFIGAAPDPTDEKVYIAITSIGYLLAIYGIGALTAFFRYKWYMQQFQRDTGFQQEEQLIQTEYSLHLPATYQYNGRSRKSWINIVNPRRGVLIMGSPGSGKSWFLIEPMISTPRRGLTILIQLF